MKFNLEKLTKVLKADTQDLLNNPKKYWNFKFQKNRGYLYVDRGANILAVAHMDTVADPNNYYYSNKDGSIFKNGVRIEKVGFDDYDITSIKLDDRLGVFMIMDVLPYLGLRYDILLTTGEEIGLSTAQYFTTKKNYNWIFEFDRRDYGTAVLYQYNGREVRDALMGCSYRIEIGSFSDVAELDYLGCAGINFGVGYLSEHTEGCYTRTSWMNVVVNMFVDFYNIFKDRKFEYIYTPKATIYNYGYKNKTNQSYTDNKNALKKGQKTGGRISYYDSYYDDYDYLDDMDYSQKKTPESWAYDPIDDKWRDITEELNDDTEIETIDGELVDDDRIQNPNAYLYPGDFDENIKSNAIKVVEKIKIEKENIL